MGKDKKSEKTNDAVKFSKPKTPGKIGALIPIVVLLGLMISNYVFDWGADPHIPVLIAAIFAMIVGKFNGHTYQEMLSGALDAVSQSLEAIVIILFVGCLIGSFEYSGTIPAVVYYGLDLVSPQMFLPLACILCAAVGIALGSAWTVTATLGIAFISMGETMGINPGLVAGMVLSGACCGDKLSPLSDSTNLAAASAQTGLFDHVRAMVTTTFPSLVIAIIIYAILSIGGSNNYDPAVAKGLQDAIVQFYDYMSPVLLIPILAIIVVALLKIPAIPAVLILSGIGVAFAVIFQGYDISDCFKMLHYGFTGMSKEELGIENDLCAKLIAKGGMDSMLYTNNLVILAVGFGGILQKIGVVEALLGGLIKKVKTSFQLVGVTILTSVFCITTMCDQYLGLIIPASIYKEKYDEMGLARNYLSRSLEDGGTLWSPLVPWSSCGAYHSSTLGVSTFAYLPYCFMNIINPIFALLTTSWGGNVLYADGSKTNFFGKLKKGKTVPYAPPEAHKKAMEALEKIRSEEQDV